MDIRDARVEAMQENLTLVRHSMNLTQTELGDYLGLAWGSVSRLENGHVKLSIPQYIALRYLLATHVEQHPENFVAKRAIEIVDGKSLQDWKDVIFSKVSHCI